MIQDKKVPSASQHEVRFNGRKFANFDKNEIGYAQNKIIDFYS